MMLICWRFNTMYTSFQLVELWWTPPHYSPPSERVHSWNIAIRLVKMLSRSSCICSGWWSWYSWRRRQERIVGSCNICCRWIFNVSSFEMTQWYYLMLAIDINSESFAFMFNSSVRTMVWLLQSPAYCILSYKDLGVVSEIATHKRFLLCMIIGWSSSHLCHHFLQPTV